MKIGNILTAISACLLFTSSSIFAQGEFLKRGEWGMGVIAGYAAAGESWYTSFAVGVSVAGVLDLGISWSKPTKGETSGYTMPSLTFYPSKHGDSPRSLTVGITLGYASVEVEEQSFGWYGFSYSSKKRVGIIMIGLDAAKRLSEDTSSFIQMSLGPTVSFGDGQSAVAIALGLSIGIGNHQAPVFVLYTSFGYRTYNKTINFWICRIAYFGNRLFSRTLTSL